MRFIKGRISVDSVILSLLSFFCISQCVELSTNGGYSILVAVDENISINYTETYIEDIKHILEEFSTLLHSSTKGRFYIDSVDVLLPSGWKISSTHPLQYISEETVRYEKADIKVSKTVSYAQIGGNRICGNPGNYLELPWELFSSPLNEAFGVPSKVLAALWTEFRYGVFEEHGYVGGSTFPYAYKPTKDGPWELTGCSDALLQGEWTFLGDGRQSPEECVVTSDDPMPPNCRFVPSADNSAKTSLLHFHWLDAVTEFCTNQTHDYFAPNRQNELCQQKSVWEVIEQSADYANVTDPVMVAPDVKFRVLQQPPLFYLLLDRSVTEETLLTLTEIWAKVFTIFAVSNPLTNSLPNHTLAAVGLFPNTEDEETEVENVIPWAIVSEHEDEFLRASNISTAEGSPGNLYNYTKALREVADRIIAKNHNSGGIILLVRNGGGGDPEHMGDETDLILMLKQKRIYVNTIELDVCIDTLENCDSWPRESLENVAKETGGVHASIPLDLDDDLTVQDTLNTVVQLVQEYSSITDLNYDILYDSLREDFAPHFIYTRKAMSSVRVVFTTVEDVTNVALLGTKYNITDFETRTEWNTNVTDESEMRTVFSIDIPQPEDEIFHLVYDGTSQAPIRGHLIAYGVYSQEAFYEDKLDVKIWTSAVGGIIPGTEPLAIYVKINKGGVPVANLNVMALIKEHEMEVNLLDNGRDCDAVANDGTYSGYYFPQFNGNFSFSVTMYTSNTENFTHAASVGLLRKDQVFPLSTSLGETRWGEEVFHDSTVTVINANLIQDFPLKVSTLVLETENGRNITATFKQPNLASGVPATGLFILKSSNSLRNLLDDFEGDIVAMGNWTGGGTVEMKFNVETDEELARYFALRTILNRIGTESKVSNAAFVKTVEATPTLAPSTTIAVTDSPDPATDSPTTPETGSPTTASAIYCQQVSMAIFFVTLLSNVLM